MEESQTGLHRQPFPSQEVETTWYRKENAHFSHGIVEMAEHKAVQHVCHDVLC